MSEFHEEEPPPNSGIIEFEGRPLGPVNESRRELLNSVCKWLREKVDLSMNLVEVFYKSKVATEANTATKIGEEAKEIATKAAINRTSEQLANVTNTRELLSLIEELMQKPSPLRKVGFEQLLQSHPHLREPVEELLAAQDQLVFQHGAVIQVLWPPQPGPLSAVVTKSFDVAAGDAVTKPSGNVGVAGAVLLEGKDPTPRGEP